MDYINTFHRDYGCIMPTIIGSVIWTDKELGLFRKHYERMKRRALNDLKIRYPEPAPHPVC